MSYRIFREPDGEDIVYLGPLRWNGAELQQLVRVKRPRENEVEEWRNVPEHIGLNK